MIQLKQGNPHGFPDGNARVSAVYVQVELTYLDADGQEEKRIVSTPLAFLQAQFGLSISDILERAGIGVPNPVPVPVPVPAPPDPPDLSTP